MRSGAATKAGCTEMRESMIEKVLVLTANVHGGRAVKLVSPGTAGIPDRLLLGSGGRLAFVEVKAPGKKPRALQAFRAEQLRSMGFQVETIDSTEAARRIAVEICG